MPNFTPNFDHLQADKSILSAHEFARRMLIDAVRQYAEFRGLSQGDLAEMTGFQRQNINRIFQGRYSPSLDNFLKIACALGMHLEISVVVSNDKSDA